MRGKKPSAPGAGSESGWFKISAVPPGDELVRVRLQRQVTGDTPFVDRGAVDVKRAADLYGQGLTLGAIAGPYGTMSSQRGERALLS